MRCWAGVHPRCAFVAPLLVVWVILFASGLESAQAVNGGGQTLYVNKYSPNASSTPGCDDPDFTEIGYAGDPSDPGFPGSGAVEDAESGDTIFICGSPDAESDPYRPNPGVGSGVTTWDKDLTFEGDGPGLTIIDGENLRTPFYANASGTYLNFRELTVRNGSDAVNGGGVEAPGRSVNLEGVAFVNNVASYGDGGAIYAGEVIADDSTFENNAASTGVGGAVAAVGRIQTAGSRFESNSAALWGGALSAGQGVAITDSTFTDNSVTGPASVGGAIYAQNVPSTIEGSTFSSNSAIYEDPNKDSDDTTFGGAIRKVGTTLTVTNSSFTGNSADEAPVISSSDEVTLDSVTMSANSGPRDIFSGGDLTIGGSIIDETGETCVAPESQEKINLGGNVISNTTAPTADCTPFVGGGGGPATRVDPTAVELQPLTDNGGPTETMALGFDSVARASGSPIAGNCLGTDQRGLVRPSTGCSSGAYQLTTEQLTVTKAGQGAGTISSSPAGIECGPDCATETADFAQNPPFTTVTLTAAPAAGSLFTGWSGDCTGSDLTCQVGLDQAREVTAEFIVEPPPIPPLPPFPSNPKLKTSLSTPDKVKAGSSFSVQVTVANRAQAANGSPRVNGNSPTDAKRLKTCLRLPGTVIPVKAKGAKAKDRSLCWKRASLSSGKRVSYAARLKVTRSAGTSRKGPSVTLQGSVTASNTSGEPFQASVKKTIRITPAKPARPSPVTG